MATEKQLAFYKGLYDEERDRLKNLREVAKFYVGLTSIYTAFIMFVAEKLQPVALIPQIIFGLTTASMLASFVLAILVLHIAMYQKVADPYVLINNMGSTPQTDEDFFDDRIIDFSFACVSNEKINNKKARLLALSSISLLISLVAHAMFFFDWLILPGGFHAKA